MGVNKDTYPPYEETQHSLPTAEYHSLLILKNKQRKRNVYVLHFIFSVFLLFSPGFCLLFTRVLSFYLSVIINYLSVIILYLSRDKTLSRLDNIETYVFCKYKIGTYRLQKTQKQNAKTVYERTEQSTETC